MQEAKIKRSRCIYLLLWTTNFKTFFLSVMNMLLIYLFASVKLVKGHKKNYLALVLKLCYHCNILQRKLKYFMEQWIK